MPSYSLAGGIDATYAVEAGTTVVTISSREQMKHRAAYVGTGQMHFHWVSEGKTQTWRCDISMVDPVETQVEEAAGGDGSQQLKVGLRDVYPAACILQGRMMGMLMAPAIHLDIPLGTDVWAFLIRSPWFPLKLQMDKPALSVAHDTSKVTASLGVQADASVAPRSPSRGQASRKPRSQSRGLSRGVHPMSRFVKSVRVPRSFRGGP